MRKQKRVPITWSSNSHQVHLIRMLGFTFHDHDLSIFNARYKMLACAAKWVREEIHQRTSSSASSRLTLSGSSNLGRFAACSSSSAILLAQVLLGLGSNPNPKADLHESSRKKRHDVFTVSLPIRERSMQRIPGNLSQYRFLVKPPNRDCSVADAILGQIV